MTEVQFYTLLPFIILATAPVLIMLAASLKRNHKLVNILSLIGFGAAFVSLFYAAQYEPVKIEPLFTCDRFALFFTGLIIGASFFITLLSYSYLEQSKQKKEEYYILLFISTLGSSILVISNHFISFFLGLEVLSVSLYTLISYLRDQDNALEAGIKYLILAAVSSAFLLFGMALVYAAMGTMDFALIGTRLSSQHANTSLAVAGFAAIMIGAGFKLGVVPFHIWTPDVYQGASSPITGFLATVSKGGMLALLLRLFTEINMLQYYPLTIIITIIAAASMLIGNLLAIRQNNVKRILAYSSISHLGYMLITLLSSGIIGIHAASFYLTAYFITTLGAFGIITVMTVNGIEADNIEDYRGLFWRNPVIAALFAAMLFSLAGIPLTAGFIGKYYLLSAGVSSSLWFLAFVLVVGSVIGLYYYLRIITIMFYHSEAPEPLPVHHVAASFPRSGNVVLAILALLLFWYGIYPETLISLIQSIKSLH